MWRASQSWLRSSGLVAQTKANVVDETTREVAALEVRELLKGSFLENAPIVATSVHTGLGSLFRVPAVDGVVEHQPPV